MDDPLYQELEPGRKIAYRLRTGTEPTLVFLPGYASDMDGTKAMAIDALAARHGFGLLRFDYSGNGLSEGEFADGTLERWLEEALILSDQLTQGPLIPIGSSMGGWIALHLALRRPQRVKALVGIAAAPDFTHWGLTADAQQVIVRDGVLEVDNPYGPEPQRIYQGFWSSGERMRLLEDVIAIDCPVRLIHGDSDREVPLEIAFRLMRQLRSADVQLNIIKGGGHRLSEDHEIAAILGAITGLLEDRA